MPADSKIEEMFEESELKFCNNTRFYTTKTGKEKMLRLGRGLLRASLITSGTVKFGGALFV